MESAARDAGACVIAPLCGPVGRSLRYVDRPDIVRRAPEWVGEGFSLGGQASGGNAGPVESPVRERRRHGIVRVRLHPR